MKDLRNTTLEAPSVTQLTECFPTRYRTCSELHGRLQSEDECPLALLMISTIEAPLLYAALKKDTTYYDSASVRVLHAIVEHESKRKNNG